VERSLAGAPFESLTTKTLDGIEIAPLYTERDRPSEEGIPWPPRAERAVGPMRALGADAGAEAREGATSLVAASVAGAPPEEILTILLSPALQPSAPRVRQAWDWWAEGQASFVPTDALVDQLADAIRAGHAVLGVATGGWEDRGAPRAHEIGLGLAGWVWKLRELERRGISLELAVEATTWLVPTGPEFFLDVAKLRAVRRAIGRVLGACGIAARPLIAATALGSDRTPADPANRILRATLGAAAALVGAADVVSAHVGGSSKWSRLERTLPLVLSHEAQLASADDPAQGSFHLETMTDDLTKRAWAVFVEIERGGGLVACRASVERMIRGFEGPGTT
jgi:methylmalonyl-CoA mutase